MVIPTGSNNPDGILAVEPETENVLKIADKIYTKVICDYMDKIGNS